MKFCCTRLKEVKNTKIKIQSLSSDSIFPQGLDDENLALDMVKAGQEVMQKSIQKAAQKHVRTGSMAKSIKCSKPVINRDGDAVGRVKFYGKDKTEC